MGKDTFRIAVIACGDRLDELNKELGLPMDLFTVIKVIEWSFILFYLSILNIY